MFNENSTINSFPRSCCKKHNNLLNNLYDSSLNEWVQNLMGQSFLWFLRPHFYIFICNNTWVVSRIYVLNCMMARRTLCTLYIESIKMRINLILYVGLFCPLVHFSFQNVIKLIFAALNYRNFHEFRAFFINSAKSFEHVKFAKIRSAKKNFTIFLPKIFQ